MKLKKWMDNGRAGALVQSVMPALLAVVVAFASGGAIWWIAILAVLGVECAHLAMNLADDYFDYKVDMKGDRDKVIRQGFRAMTAKYPYLTDGSETLRTTAKAIAQFSLVAVICGAVIFAYRIYSNGFAGPQGAWWIVAIVLACAFLGFFYSGPPLKLAYRGIGELIIGIIFGPLLMMGVYYACCGKVDLNIVFISIPVGLLVLNILFTHSFIDMPGDAQSNKMTFARLLGSSKACLVFSAIFIFVPFLMVVAAVILGHLHPAYLAVVLVLPRAIWLFRSLVLFSKGQMMEIPAPPKWLGPMPGWDAICKAHIDWFLARWFCARNLLSGFCILTGIVAIILMFV